ncbi:hydrogenase [Bradyrhizobium pachyrhizi]|uniref:Hydrogenase n=1 Tax=Bradyrhizobium pachyrhizi TaxID=280333 RepID=A0A844SNK5_9BRAD|nr:cytochrome b/b6 domain-containing protein [Bradyrhizobium pachyrhizi]MVT65484.1 hydrogenase [Bradyrhizobium pachyrhizi]WFU56207.1 cytochrome b/b6 domain-containing protein [Bradyrhizobium pachyrhizi]
MTKAAPGARGATSVQVWDLPLRLWHWALAILVLVAWVTPSTYDRVHRVAGYSVIALLAFRLIWGFAGTRYARFGRLGVRLRAAPRYIWNLRRGITGRYIGLNPAGTVMLVALLFLLTISTITGAMEVTVTFFGVWWVEDTHAYASDAVMVLVGLHVLGVVVVGLLQRQNLVRAMFTGRKQLRNR